MQANTIDEVISYLKEIIEDSKLNQSKMGYFAALYYLVTVNVREGILDKKFEDNKRMEKLDVIFANRYLKAYTQFKNGEKCSECWEIAFQQTGRFWPIVLQDLLLGMNAHINLDLGIAAAEVSPGDKIHGLKNDFDKINTILAGLVKSVEEDLSEIWPTLTWILKKTGKFDSELIDFSMRIARDGAWEFATSLAQMDPSQQPGPIAARDRRISDIASLITNPGYIASFVFMVIRIGEKGTVAEQIAWLEQEAAIVAA